MAKISAPANESKDTLLEFPSTLSVLVIDNNLKVLEFIKKTCNQYGNQVMACSESLRAINVLRKRKGRIDLIITEVHMPIIDGYEFLQYVNKEQINIPLIMMSWDDSRTSIMKAIKLGACDYWIKPLHEYQFQSMWTHVLRKYISEEKRQNDTGSMEDDNKIRGIGDNSEFALSMVHRSNGNFREDNDVDESENSNPPSTRKNRLVWSSELHHVFLQAIEKIGFENAVPKKILEAMDIPGLERSHVSSHLQKYRKVLRQRQKQNEMSLVSGNTEPRTRESGRIYLQPLTGPALTDFHPGLTDNMVPRREEQSNSNIQLTDYFRAEEALAHDNPDFPNIAGTENFPPSTGAEDDSLLSLSDTVLVDNPAMLQRSNMQQSRMHCNQNHTMNFQPSSIIISGNPASNFVMNVDHGLISPLSIGGNSTGEVILHTRASIYYPHLQNAGLPSGAVRSFALSDFNSQNPSADIDDKEPWSS